MEEAHRRHGATFSATIDVLESMGSDKYAYFTVQGGKASAAELDELAADSGIGELGDGSQVVARLSAESQVQVRQPAELWYDADKVALFDQQSGRNITLG